MALGLFVKVQSSAADTFHVVETKSPLYEIWLSSLERRLFDLFVVELAMKKQNVIWSCELFSPDWISKCLQAVVLFSLGCITCWLPWILLALLGSFLIGIFSFRTFRDAQAVCRDSLPLLRETQDEGAEPTGKHVKDDPWKFELFLDFFLM